MLDQFDDRLDPTFATADRDDLIARLRSSSPPTA